MRLASDNLYRAFQRCDHSETLPERRGQKKKKTGETKTKKPIGQGYKTVDCWTTAVVAYWTKPVAYWTTAAAYWTTAAVAYGTTAVAYWTASVAYWTTVLPSTLITQKLAPI